MEQFDYESKMWGSGKVKTSPFCFGASQLEFALEDIRNISGKALEVGCGAGGMAKAIKFYRPDLNVSGIDISKKAITEAKQSSQGVKFAQGDAYKLPFKDKSFDAVLMFDLLEHLDDPLKSLLEIRRVLKPRGVFSSFIPIEGSMFSIPGLIDKFFGYPAKKKYAGHIQQFTLSDLLTLLEKTDLKFINKRYYGYLVFQLVDLIYFTYLSLRGKNVPYTVEGYLAQERGLKKSFLALIKSAIAATCYFESKIFRFLPGSGVHLAARG
jgi:ubiquinone/menaquinone biosynthesis C-methylase UbiE